MAANKLYSIGEVSKLCNISTKALRFYDKIGVIAPDEVGENGYRYYPLDTILRIPILKADGVSAGGDAGAGKGRRLLCGRLLLSQQDQ